MSATSARPSTSGLRSIALGVVGVVLLGGAAIAVAKPVTLERIRYELTNSPGVRNGDVTATPYEPVSADLGSADLGSANAGVVRLAVAGDVGTGDAHEFATATAIDRLETWGEYDALLLLGDNVYPNGNAAELQSKVFEPFSDVLDGGTTLLPVLGNHDNDFGYAAEQIAGLGMPGAWYATRIDDVLIVSLDSNHPDNGEQLAWLDDLLASTDATWKIVEMHHPPYSGGAHGSDRDVRNAFSPLFEKYGVQLVLTGHDHDYQRTRPIGGVTYVVSGGAATLRSANRADFADVALSIYHFTDITVVGDRLELRAVDQAGMVFDVVTIMSTPVASTPVASTPVASTPVASTPVASTPVASTSVASEGVSP